jgi:hypothetical protein
MVDSKADETADLIGQVASSVMANRVRFSFFK